ncbi:DUF433 domain-containing protein [Sorangium sp. So ce1014]|uniref:DUF433 domain-containing protein n=1 Tax=Sorangium sp. So ce1014 TaxID=3133326 RepID=UPI003F5D97E6
MALKVDIYDGQAPEELPAYPVPRAARLYPWVRSTGIGSQPKTIVVDPRRGFGQPVLAGTGIEARIVTERYRAGESVRLLAKDYGVEIEKIEDAIRCEMREAA